jgi:PKD repeat protein
MKGDNRIIFSLTGNAPVRIQLAGGDLPIIQDRTGGLLIDGYSQNGSSVNTLTYGSNAVPGVEIRGNTGSSRGNAFRMTSAYNTIRGFLLTAHYRSIFMDGPDAHHNEILGNLIGFTRTGAVDSYRGNHGVRLNVGASFNRVGGPALADRNVIGNFTHAIDFYGPGTDSNTVQNNVLCMTPNGGGAATCATGIDHNFGPKNNLEGGADAAERNYIGPTTLNGIEISHGWDPDTRESNTKWQLQYNRIIGNWIGFRGDGNYDPNFRSGQNTPNSNDSNGVNVYDGSSFNLVEGNTIGARWDGINTMSPTSTGNVFRNNIIGQSPLGQPAPLGRYGINVRVSTKSHVIEGNIIRNAAIYGIALTQKNVLWIRISRNIITDMSGPAIYLEPDPNDPSKGANNLLKAPVITSATTVRATGTGIPGATVEVYKASRPAGQSGLPEQYLGSALVAANGTWTTPIVVATGDRVVGLQINAANNTSALGTNVTATFEAPPQKPVADFAWSQRAGTLTVDFTDASTNAPAQWSWTFGDGTSSTMQNPSKTYALAADYTVTLTATNGGGTGSVTKTITVQPLPAGTTYAADAFGRTVSGWGNADIGGAYSLQGDAANYAVSGGVGTMQFASGGASRAALLNAVSQRDVDVSFRVSTDKVAAGGNYTVYAVTRRTGTNEYRARIIFNANGTVSVNASVLDNGVESSLGAPVVVPGVVQGANSFIWFRAQVTGASPTTIRVKAWAEGQAEPAYQFTVTHSLAAVQVAGSLGLRAYVANTVTTAPLVLSFDDYSVRSPI